MKTRSAAVSKKADLTAYDAQYSCRTESPKMPCLWTGVRCCIGARQALRVHSPSGSTFLSEITSWPPSWNNGGKMRLGQSMRIYLKNNPAKIHPDPILKRLSLNISWRGRPNKNKKKNNKLSSDVRSVSKKCYTVWEIFVLFLLIKHFQYDQTM